MGRKFLAPTGPAPRPVLLRRKTPPSCRLVRPAAWALRQARNESDREVASQRRDRVWNMSLWTQWSRVPRGRRVLKGKTRPFGHQEGICGDAQCDVVV